MSNKNVTMADGSDQLYPKTFDYNVYNSSNVSLNNVLYPIHSIYMSTSNVSPASFFGGTWTRLKDVFLMCAGDTYTAGGSGGSATHTHTLEDGYADCCIGWSNSWNNHLLMRMKSVVGSSRTITKMNGNSFTDVTSNTGWVTALGGSTDSASTLPPYKTVYVWERTA